MNIEFDKIYFNQSKKPGFLRIADQGLGWKEAASQDGSKKKPPFLLPFHSIVSAQWSRASKGYEVRLQTRENKVIMLDGFEQSSFNQLKNELKRHFDLNLEQKDHNLRGWNWGTTTMARSELVFNINNKPDFELPYQGISNINLTGKNEVAIEFKNEDEEDRQGDELVEMRLYIPGTVEVEVGSENIKKEKIKEEGKDDEEAVKQEGEEVKKEGEESDAESDKVEEQSAASYFYEQLKDKASIGQVTGDAIVSFSDVFFVTPRGRYDLDMYSSSLRLRGKTYDNKIQFRQIERIFSLPKPDDVHHLVVVQIDPPLTQGQTRYSFLTMQFPKEEIIDVELNIDDEEYQEKFKDKLKKLYVDQSTHSVISHCFKGLTDRRVTIPGMFKSKNNHPAVSCSLKASEGYLYFLEKSFLFVIKPTVYIPFSEVSSVQMSRLGQTASASKTFDLEVQLRNGSKHNFANIARDEQRYIENYLQDKGIRVKNEDEEGKALLNSALGDDDDDDDGLGAGSDESEDESFDENDASDDDDVPEEYDSEHADSGDDSEDEPAKKKAKK